LFVADGIFVDGGHRLPDVQANGGGEFHGATRK
jgi:hypothetical protein